MGHMEHMAIEWREINPDYIVSSDGQVGSRKSGTLIILRPGLDTHGYPTVAIGAKGETRSKMIHHLVAKAFIGPKPTPKHEVNHKNGIRTDNRVENLEYVTRSENMIHRHRVLKHGNPSGEKCWCAKLTESQVRDIRARRAAGETIVAVAKSYGVGASQVSRITRREKWAWLDAKENT